MFESVSPFNIYTAVMSLTFVPFRDVTIVVVNVTQGRETRLETNCFERKKRLIMLHWFRTNLPRLPENRNIDKHLSHLIFSSVRFLWREIKLVSAFVRLSCNCWEKCRAGVLILCKRSVLIITMQPLEILQDVSNNEPIWCWKGHFGWN